MTDENVNEGTSAGAEVPDDDQTQAESTSAEAEVLGEEQAAVEESPAAEEVVAEAEVEEPAQAEQPAAEADEPVSEAEPAVEAEEPTADESSESGTSAPAEVPKKRKRLPRALRRQRSKPKREKPKDRRPIARLPKPEQVRGRRQERQGTVVSAATDKTIVVRVDTVKMHPRYKKVIRRSTKLHAHDESNQAKLGDIVRIVETRPISKLKRWRLREVVQEAK
jgi:small subunit ribosomal protein S17